MSHHHLLNIKFRQAESNIEVVFPGIEKSNSNSSLHGSKKCVKRVSTIDLKNQPQSLTQFKSSVITEQNGGELPRITKLGYEFDPKCDGITECDEKQSKINGLQKSCSESGLQSKHFYGDGGVFRG